MTAGPTIEYIDPVRVITNLSTGKTGVLLASELVSAGAKVTLVYGPGSEKPPKGAKIIPVKTTKQMADAVKKEMKKRFDIVIMSAAAADYTPENQNQKKIKSSNSKVVIKLKKIPKIIEQVKKKQKDVFLVGFKAETNLSKTSLLKEARKKIEETGADLIIANDIGSERYKKNPQNNEVLLVDSKKTFSSGWKRKEKIAKLIVKEIEKRIEN